MHLRRLWLPAALSIAFAALLCWQVFLPHFIGWASNGDFAKVYGWLVLTPRDGGDLNFSFFQPDYFRREAKYWESPYYSSETVLGWLAVHLSHATVEGAHFDIRVQGAIHAAILMAAFLVLLISLRRLPWWGVCAVAGMAMLAFTDVCYTAYINSFFMDAAAMFSLTLMVATGAWIAVTDRPSTGQFLLFGLAGLIYVTSKTQHAIWMLLPAAFILLHGFRAKRTAGYVAAALLVAGGAFELGTAEPSNKAQALFNKLFYQLGPAGADLREIGVRPEELRFVGTHSYMAGSPALDAPWVDEFYTRTGYGRLLAWYLRHPAVAAKVLHDALSINAPEMRQNNLSNYSQEEGHPAGARTSRFAAWSGLRSALLTRWPYHIVIWYVLFVAGALVTMRRNLHAAAGRVAALGLGVAVLGIGQFLVPSLADCLETPRHLLFFHVCTELTFCFAVAGLVFGSLKTPCEKPSSLPS